MRRLLALLIIAAAVGGFMWLKSSRPPPPPVEARERVWRVAAEVAVPVTANPMLTVYGRTEAPDKVRAAAPVSGRVLEVRVRDGERVEPGQLLARLDPRDIEPRLVQARAEVERENARAAADRRALEQERALLALAEAKLERFGSLASARVGAETAADQAREEVARARLAVNQRSLAIAEQPARLAQFEARLAEAQRDAERAEIRAPFVARIARVEVAAGDQVQAGQTLLIFHSADGLFLRARLPAIYSAEMALALQRGERLSAELLFGTERLNAHLERIGGEADVRGVEAVLALDGGADRVPVGAFVSAVLQRPQVEEVFSLPMSALHGGDRIYRIETREGRDRLFGLRVERVGEHRVDGVPRMLVRVPGLGEDERIVITHLPNAIDGLAVEVASDQVLAR